MEKENKKEIIVFTELSRGGFALAKKIISFFVDDEVFIIYYSFKKNKFIKGEDEIESIENLILKADFVFNFLPIKTQVSRNLSRKIENLKIPTLNNSLNCRLLFFSKNNLKRFFQKYNIKSPVFTFLGEKTPEELFANFPQPSRIFSKLNKYFSEKIDTLERMKKVFFDIGKNKSDYLIEEYIEGTDSYSFVIKQKDDILIFNLSEGILGEEKNLLHRKMTKLSKNIIFNFDIDKFALIHYRINKIRSIFLLNIFVEMDIFLGEKSDILKKILQEQNLELSEIIKILKKNEEKEKNTLLQYL